MRARLAILMVTAFAATAAAQDSATPAPEARFDIRLEPLPPVDALTDMPPLPDVAASPEAKVEIALPDLPAVDVAIPESTRSEPATHHSPQTAQAEQPAAGRTDTAGRTDIALPTLPEPDDPFARIVLMPEPAPRQENASAPPPPEPSPARPLERNASAPAPAIQAPAASAPMPAAPPAPAIAQKSLQAEALEKALVELAAIQPLPGPLMQGVRDFYAHRDNAPAWTTGGALNPAARAIAATAADAEAQGLNAARFQKLAAAATSPDASLEKREAAIAALGALYARDARGGRINPQQVSRLVTALPPLPETAAVLDELAQASNPARALEAYNPAHPGYLALKARLADLRSTDVTASVAPKLTFGRMLTLGMSDERVPLLRNLLALPPAESLVYDGAMAEAVKTVQRERGLKVSGRLDRATVASLGGVDPELADSRNPKADIIANMERWRWLPTDLGANHVFVNIPNYSLTLMHGGEPALKTRVIVGKPQNQTPIFSHRIQFLVVNPSWNVPPSIATKELLPLLQKNPNALAARGLQVISRGKVVDPATVDWSAVGRTVAIRQPPGERNALGNIKFMFPNDHAVYLHDTPSRSLFANDRRAYSHGCVRVQDPFRLAEALLGAGWSEGRLKSMIGGGERQVKMPTDVPVHLVYFTTFVDDAGALQSREDIYGHNRKLKTLLAL